MKSFRAIAIMLSLLPVSCSDSKIQESDLPFFDIYVEYSATNQNSNTLVIKSNESGFLYKVEKSNVQTEFPVHEVQALQERTELYYSDEGEYVITVKVYLEDQSIYTQKDLKWTYDRSLPSLPIVAFSEKASNDEKVQLLISGSTSLMADEIWIEGDLGPANSPEGAWYEIPSTGILPITLSDGDSLKRFKVKTRTRAGTESEQITMSINRKSTMPELCRAELPQLTNERQVRLYLEGDPDETLFYRVYGDTANDFQYHEFRGVEVANLLLSSGEGEKNVTVQIKDLADNFCLKEVKTIEYDSSHDPAGVAIVGDPIWTNDLNVSVDIAFDTLPSDTLEIYVHGGVEGANTHIWMPYQDNINVRLSPSEGHRWVRVSFRLNGEEVGQAWDGVYLNPFIVLQGSSSPYTILMSNIIELDSVTITGCAESYNDISFTTGLSCTAPGGAINADYTLNDGTVVSVSTSP